MARKLQLGVTLKPSAAGGDGFELDLRTPDAHKTAALFGPSTTAAPPQPASCPPFVTPPWRAPSRGNTPQPGKRFVRYTLL